MDDIPQTAPVALAEAVVSADDVVDAEAVDEEEEVPEAEAVTTEPTKRRSRSAALDEPAPRRRSKDEDEEDEDAPRRKRSRANSDSNTLLIVVVACVGGGILVLMSFGVIFWMVSSRPTPPAQAGNNVAPNPVQVPNQPIGNQPGQQPVVVNPGPIRVPNNPPPPVVLPRPNPNPIPPVPQEVPWRVAVDAGGQTVRQLVNPNRTIPLPNNGLVVFPSSFSPFVVVGRNLTAQDARQIWNLETMELIGSLQGQIPLVYPIVLSPDGKYLAAKNRNFPNAMEVYSTVAGAAVQRLTLDGPGVPPLADFAGPGQFLTVERGGQQPGLARVWDINTGKVIRQFDLQALPHDPRVSSISPGGKYLAFLDSSCKLVVYDLVQGLCAGTATHSLQQPGEAPMTPKGLAFSPDGVELAALFGNLLDQRLLVWDVTRGTLTRQHQLKGLRDPSPPRRVYTGPVLDWVPDRSGWLLFNTSLVDVVSGSVVWTMPMPVETNMRIKTVRRLLSPDYLANAPGGQANRQLQLQTLPREQINQAIQAARAGNR